ncbi:MAG: DUF47 family protein [bacterium]|nr:DUF47 family protein [bacterium]
MRLDRILQALLPHDEHFFTFFEESANTIATASALLCKLPGALPGEREQLIAKISECEHAGDNITHQVFEELNRTFVTPFDREDIHMLASELDDILDYIDGSARRIHLYKVNNCPPAMLELMECLHLSVMELTRGIPMLRNFSKPEALKAVIQKVNEYENTADSIFQRAIADLFDNEPNAIEIIKLKEIFVALETATDKCEDVANVFETLLIKHA